MRASLLALATLALAPSTPAADLASFKTVYILPMTHGLDQYLAVRLSRGPALQVVTDPQKADLVFTDQIGAGFEEKLNSLYGEPNTKPAPEKSAGKDAKASKDQIPEGFARPQVTSSSRGRGAIFLVDRRTRTVVWSDYALAKTAAPDDLNRLADKIATAFEKQVKGK